MRAAHVALALVLAVTGTAVAQRPRTLRASRDIMHDAQWLRIGETALLCALRPQSWFDRLTRLELAHAHRAQPALIAQGIGAPVDYALGAYDSAVYTAIQDWAADRPKACASRRFRRELSALDALLSLDAAR